MSLWKIKGVCQLSVWQSASQPLRQTNTYFFRCNRKFHNLCPMAWCNPFLLVCVAHFSCDWSRNECCGLECQILWIIIVHFFCYTFCYLSIHQDNIYTNCRISQFYFKKKTWWATPRSLVRKSAFLIACIQMRFRLSSHRTKRYQQGTQ